MKLFTTTCFYRLPKLLKKDEKEGSLHENYAVPDYRLCRFLSQTPQELSLFFSKGSENVFSENDEQKKQPPAEALFHFLQKK